MNDTQARVSWRRWTMAQKALLEIKQPVLIDNRIICQVSKLLNFYTLNSIISNFKTSQTKTDSIKRIKEGDLNIILSITDKVGILKMKEGLGRWFSQ